MNNDRQKIINYLNKIKGKPKKKDIDYLSKKFKINYTANKRTIIQKLNFIKSKYKINKKDLLNEITIKNLKKILKKNNINIKGLATKKKMFTLFNKIKNSKSQILYGYYSNIGKREYQEDRIAIHKNLYYYISGIFDGHAGNKCSSYLKNNFYKVFIKYLLIKKQPTPTLYTTFHQLDNFFLNNINGNDGSTANVLFCDKNNNTCYLANTGDSRAILCKKNGQVSQISEDHKPDIPKEKRLIENKGGFVKNGRTNGNLAMSRAFGDKNLKNVITVEPDIYQFSSNNVKFIVQGSDGLFDVMRNNEICNFVNLRLNRKINPNIIAKELVYYAINNRGSHDNTSVVISIF